MASIVRQIESAVIAALDTELDGAARVQGFRESVAEGLVKTSDGDGRPEVLVSVNPPTAETYGVNKLEFDVNVQVRLEWADDPTIAAFDEIAAIVEDLLMRWNLNANIATVVAALSTDNFRCCGLRMNGGSDSASIGERSYISSTFSFAVKGMYTETTGETT